MKIAVVGCTHGELDKMYEDLKQIEAQQGVKADLLLCCGDFQAVRNPSDLNSMAVPPKYRQLNTFYRYYSGESKAPILTVFIGGNHEASNYLSELPYGGWVAPNIFYMGLAAVIKVGNLRIGGVSGIFKPGDYTKGRFERPPYTPDSLRSVYHVRNLEIFRLKHLSDVDIFLSHDWPRGIHTFGNATALFRLKPYFRSEAEQGILGSPPLRELLDILMPKFWFAAHMHVKFEAEYKKDREDGLKQEETTKFLALDKCIPRRPYIQIIDIPDNGSPPIPAGSFPILQYDKHWLAILKSTDHLMSLSSKPNYLPDRSGVMTDERCDFTPTEEELKTIDNLFYNDFDIPRNFSTTAAVYENNTQGTPKGAVRNRVPPAAIHLNPQTTEFCDKLGIRNLNALLINQGSVGFNGSLGNLITVKQGDEPVTPRSPFVLPTPSSKRKISTNEQPPLFFIDTTPNNSRRGQLMDSPMDASLNSSRLSIPESFIVDTPELPKFDKDHLGSLEDADDKVMSPALIHSTPTGKVLKRRNAAIYQEEDEGTND